MIPSRTDIAPPDLVVSDLTLEELAVLAQEHGAGSVRDAYFSELVKRMRGRLSSFLLRRTGREEDVEDLVQETFLRAYSNLERYEPKWRFSTWIFTIATRLAVNQHRSRRSVPLPRMSTTDELSENPASLVAEREESVRLWATAKATLSDAQYAVIWLHYARDMSVKEIAETTGRTAIHVRVLLYRARRKLATEVSCSAP